MRIIIDGKPIDVYDDSKNIVDIADDYRITIPAPCYQNSSGGCCQACAITVNGKLAYACTTKPTDGMTIAVNTPKLKALRAKNLATYNASLKVGKAKQCGGNCNCSNGGCH